MNFNIPVRVGIALGSNMGDRQAHLEAGVAFVRSLSIDDLILESPRIETAPVDCPPGSARFLNAVVEIDVDRSKLPPRELLNRLRDFETMRGRSLVHATNAPRPLDLDIIYYGNEMIFEPDLIIPHPRATLRRFVLEPLAYLHSDLVLPGQVKTVGELLAELPKAN